MPLLFSKNLDIVPVDVATSLETCNAAAASFDRSVFFLSRRGTLEIPLARASFVLRSNIHPCSPFAFHPSQSYFLTSRMTQRDTSPRAEERERERERLGLIASVRGGRSSSGGRANVYPKSGELIHRRVISNFQGGRRGEEGKGIVTSRGEKQTS